ncbi:MAG: class II glutamine amidotransferase, partial [Myxococcales bacterium]|nr:class II glutamine amidotransferase [Myxococcales bacterium]
MSSRLPTNVRLSLSQLLPRGGETGPHRDGWGVAFAQGNEFLILKEACAAASSEWIDFLENHEIRSQLVIAHIRLATHPKRLALANTHPFERAAWGRPLVFAHNGKAPQLLDRERYPLRRFHPLGETDSEAAFCFLLERLVDRIGLEPSRYRVGALVEVLREHSPLLLGEENRFNVLLSDGEYLIAHGGHQLHVATRHCCCDGMKLDASLMTPSLRQSEEQDVAVIATKPLTDD